MNVESIKVLLVRLIPFYFFMVSLNSYNQNMNWSVEFVLGLWFLFGMLFVDLVRSKENNQKEKVKSYLFVVATWPRLLFV